MIAKFFSNAWDRIVAGFSTMRIAHLAVGVVLGLFLLLVPRAIVASSVIVVFALMIESKIPINHADVRAEWINRGVILAGFLIVLLICYGFGAV